MDVRTLAAVALYVVGHRGAKRLDRRARRRGELPPEVPPPQPLVFKPRDDDGPVGATPATTLR